MTTTDATCTARRTHSATRARFCAIATLALVAGGGLAQEATPPPEASPAPPAQAPRPFEPGFLDALGRWFGRGAEDLNAKRKSAIDDMGEKARAAAAGAKEAADKLSKLPSARVVEGRQRCDVAPSGSPDCRAAVDTICRAKGFATGKSIDIQQAEKCSIRSWLAGGPAKRDCKLETHVTRAMCQ